jgi:hypothetical protein
MALRFVKRLTGGQIFRRRDHADLNAIGRESSRKFVDS